MSQTSDVVKVRKVVVFFDICSSTTFLEDLLRTENEHLWYDLLTAIKRFLMADCKETEIYKFLGDGWVLLFDDESITGDRLMKLLRRLCIRYERLFKNSIAKVLATKNYKIGLTFGIDHGTLIKMVMTGRVEFIGRALNVASRLRGAIGQKDKAPNNKLLITKSAHTFLNLASSQRYVGKLVQRNLRNISGGEDYWALKIVLHR